jgi:hypothetical protein
MIQTFSALALLAAMRARRTCRPRGGGGSGRAALFALVNADHADVPVLGQHPGISRIGRNVDSVFTPFWAALTALNSLGLTAATT